MWNLVVYGGRFSGTGVVVVVVEGQVGWWCRGALWEATTINKPLLAFALLFFPPPPLPSFASPSPVLMLMLSECVCQESELLRH